MTNASLVEGQATGLPAPQPALRLKRDWMWDTYDPREIHMTWVKDTWDALRDEGAGEPYVNFADDDRSDVHATNGKARYHPLVELKDRYDPTNVLHLNQNVRESGRDRPEHW